MISNSQAENIVSLLDIKKDEKIFLIFDETTSGIVIPMYNIIKSKTPHLNISHLSSYKRPLLEIPYALKERLSDIDLVFYAIKDYSNDSIKEVNFRRGIVNSVETNGGRVGFMISPTKDIINSAFNFDPIKIRDLTKKVYDYMKTVSEVRVFSEEGSDFIVELNNKWLASTGFIEKGVTRNAMPAEVYTFPSYIEGKVAITGSYAQIISRDVKNPIYWEIHDSKITNVNCKDKTIESIVAKEVFEKLNADRIGEYGMGTNIGIQKCLGNIMHDKKYPGVHLANGKGFPQTGANYESDVHYDGIILKPTVINLKDGKVIMEKGNYNLSDSFL